MAGRSVIKGEKALRVWIPKRGKAVPADLSTMTEAQQREYFVRGPVFDISQTKECAPRHRAAGETDRRHAAEFDAMDRAFAEYHAAIESGDIPADLEFDIWYELREETRLAALIAEPVAYDPRDEEADAYAADEDRRYAEEEAIEYTGGTIATAAGVVIAQYQHIDLYAPVSGGSQENEEETATPAVSDDHTPICEACGTYEPFCTCEPTMLTLVRQLIDATRAYDAALHACDNHYQAGYDRGYANQYQQESDQLRRTYYTASDTIDRLEHAIYERCNQDGMKLDQARRIVSRYA
jgi:hypothetical protein